VYKRNKSFFCASFGQKCPKETRGVSHCDLSTIYIKKYLKAKEELPKLKYNFTIQKYNFPTIL
jgi:hypothetical protein